MSFNTRRAGFAVAETVRALAEPRRMTALDTYRVGFVFPAPVQGSPDLQATATRGLCSDTGSWQADWATFWDNFATGGDL